MEECQHSTKVATERKQRGPRSEEAAERRRQRDKGPWPCPLCDHSVMGNISTLRRHVIGQHNRYCSWSGQIRPFDNVEEAERIKRVVSRPKSSRHTQSLSPDEDAAPCVRLLHQRMAEDTEATSTEGHTWVTEQDGGVQSAAAAASASSSLTSNESATTVEHCPLEEEAFRLLVQGLLQPSDHCDVGVQICETRDTCNLAVINT